MRLLLDESVPARLYRALPDHQVSNAVREGSRPSLSLSFPRPVVAYLLVAPRPLPFQLAPTLERAAPRSHAPEQPMPETSLPPDLVLRNYLNP